jgi:ankyrin repeat protein
LTRWLRFAAAVTAAGLVSACAADAPPRGGDKEQALAAATLAADIAKVNELLAAGANPNLRVDVQGNDESSWYLALDSLRPNRPATIDIVKAMLKSGADPSKAWGHSMRAPESFSKSLMRSSRVGGPGNETPLHLIMFNPVPELVRAVVQPQVDPRDGQSALVDAIESGEIEIAHILVDAGVDVNCQPTAVTPLVAAIERRDVALMTYLEEHGAREKP